MYSYIRINDIDIEDFKSYIRGDDLNSAENADSVRLLWQMMYRGTSEINEYVNGDFLNARNNNGGGGPTYRALSDTTADFLSNIPQEVFTGSVLRVGGSTGEIVSVGLDDSGARNVFRNLGGTTSAFAQGTAVELLVFPGWLQGVMARWMTQRATEKGGRNVRRLEAEDRRLLNPYVRSRY